MKFRVTDSSTSLTKKGKPITWESALTKLFGGLAFIGVSIALANSDIGRGWWFWMLIPALTMIGAGLAHVIQIKSNQKNLSNFDSVREMSKSEQKVLPPNQTEYVSPVMDNKFRTGNLVPPSVIDNTTHHLEVNSEGETMTLPKSAD